MNEITELKEKILRLTKALNTRITYEITFSCPKFGDRYGALQELHCVRADGFVWLHRCSVQQILQITTEDFTAEEKGE